MNCETGFPPLKAYSTVYFLFRLVTKHKNVTCATIWEIIEFIIFDEIQQAGVSAELEWTKNAN